MILLINNNNDVFSLFLIIPDVRYKLLIMEINMYVTLQERKKYVVQWEKEKATIPKQNKQIKPLLFQNW